MQTPEKLDAAFYDMIHHLIEAQSIDLGGERREGERRDYEHVQLLAPYRDSTMPVQADFHQARCQDISPTGFSFHAWDRPDFERVVVALGTVPFVFFIAEVVHVREIHNNGTPQYLIGCQFVERIE